MTDIGVQATPGPMAPKQFIGENLNLLLPEGTKDRIKAVLLPGEKRLAFIRDAIAREIKRREKAEKAKS